MGVYPSVKDKMTEIDVCAHDYEHPIRKGRADYRCPKCGENIMLMLVFIAECEELK
jgi:predicted RNA-binding Zn-ribbon protein involved in translation (DUF1610 family)